MLERNCPVLTSIWSQPVWGFWSLKCFSTIRILPGVFICLYSKYLNMFQVQQSTCHWAERIKMTDCILAHTSVHTFQTNSYLNIKCRPFWLKWQCVNHPLNSSTEALQWRTWSITPSIIPMKSFTGRTALQTGSTMFKMHWFFSQQQARVKFGNWCRFTFCN